MKVALLSLAVLLFGIGAKADTVNVFDYKLTDVANGMVFTWSLTGVPNTPHILPQFSSQVGQPGDIMVTMNGVTEPNYMSMTANSLLFQCDPTMLCNWDEASPMDFETSSPLLSGSQLLTGDFIGNQVWFWGVKGNLQLVVTDPPINTPEPSTVVLLFVGLLALAGMAALLQAFQRKQAWLRRGSERLAT